MRNKKTLSFLEAVKMLGGNEARVMSSTKLGNWEKVKFVQSIRMIEPGK